MKILKENLAKAQQRTKSHTDKERTGGEFEVGDWVYLKLQLYRQSSVSMRKNMKLAPKFYWPLKILEKFGTVAYKLELPNTSRIYSQLKKHLGTAQLNTQLP